MGCLKSHFPANWLGNPPRAPAGVLCTYHGIVVKPCIACKQTDYCYQRLYFHVKIIISDIPGLWLTILPYKDIQTSLSSDFINIIPGKYILYHHIPKKLSTPTLQYLRSKLILLVVLHYLMYRTAYTSLPHNRIKSSMDKQLENNSTTFHALTHVYTEAFLTRKSFVWCDFPLDSWIPGLLCQMMCQSSG